MSFRHSKIRLLSMNRLSSMSYLRQIDLHVSRHDGLLGTRAMAPLWSWTFSMVGALRLHPSTRYRSSSCTSCRGVFLCRSPLSTGIEPSHLLTMSMTNLVRIRWTSNSWPNPTRLPAPAMSRLSTPQTHAIRGPSTNLRPTLSNRSLVNLRL